MTRELYEKAKNVMDKIEEAEKDIEWLKYIGEHAARVGEMYLSEKEGEPITRIPGTLILEASKISISQIEKEKEQFEEEFARIGEM